MDQAELTCIIQQAQGGDAAARNALFELIYKELHRHAERLVRQYGPAGEPSSLIHEGYMRLFPEGKPLDIPNRRYFYFCAIRKMRDILIERIRKEHRHPEMSPLDSWCDQFLADFQDRTKWEYAAVHDVLNRFINSSNARKRRRHELIELIYLADVSMKDAAELLEISYSQAGEDKRLALAELEVELERLAP